MFFGVICSGDTEELIDILIREGTPVDTYEFDNEVARYFATASSWVLRCILHVTNNISRQPTHYSNMAQIRIV